MTVTFDPDTYLESYEGALTINSDDPDEGSVTVDLTGKGVGEVKLITNENSSGAYLAVTHGLDLQGNVLAAGGYVYRDHKGGVWIFNRNGEDWVQTQLLEVQGGGGAQVGFGHSLDIDGDYLAVGAVNDNSGGIVSTGAVYIFRRNGENWDYQTRLTSNQLSTYSAWGYSISLDGNYMAAGAIYADVGGVNNAGRVVIFHRDGQNWTQTAVLQSNDPQVNARYGFSVDLLGDYLIVGCTFEDNHAGSAFVYHREGENWNLQMELHPDDRTANQNFGEDVNLQGNYAIVGANGDEGSMGAVYVFLRNGENWTQQSKLVANDRQAGAQFGQHVRFSGDRILIGAVWDDLDVGEDAGSIYLFERDGNDWIQVEKIVANDRAAYDGNACSISFTGNIAVSGAAFDDNENGNDAGCVYLFTIDDAVPDIVVSPGSLDFGNVDPNGETADQTVTISNDGNGDLIVSNFTSDNNAFTTDFGGQQVITPGNDLMVTITFTPDAVQTYNGNLTIASDDSDEGTVVVALTGTGYGTPDITVAPATIDFGNVDPNGETADQIVMISNEGNGDLTIYSITSNNNAFRTNFGGQQTIAPGGNLQVTVTFDPDTYLETY